MKGRMEVTMDTVWTNQIVLSVECEFDNPHTVTTPMLSELMVRRLKMMVEEIRHADTRSLPELEVTLKEEASTRDDGNAEREQRAYDDMKERDAQRRSVA